MGILSSAFIVKGAVVDNVKNKECSLVQAGSDDRSYTLLFCKGKGATCKP